MRRPLMTNYPVNAKDEHFAGFDLSLTASGIVILDAAGNVKERHIIKVKTRGAERLDDIQKAIRSIIAIYNIRLVCIEGYATGAIGKTYNIGELGGVIRILLYRKGIPYFDPKPTQLKKFATGKGGGDGASKDQVTLHVFKKWDFEAKDNNEADAYVLCRIAMALCGKDSDLTPYQKEVIAQIKSMKKNMED